MKRILFIENRQHTFTWEWIADYLRNFECEIYWIVENHFYAPKGRNVFKIPYPKRADIDVARKKGMPEEVRAYIAFTDRNVNFYGCSDTSYYYYYYHEISRLLGMISPDYVFGESTQFHELITISICKSRKILYLQPTSCRYPANRFSFYLYDTLEPYGVSGESYTYKQALLLANDIANRNTEPSYMKDPPFCWKDFLQKQFDKLTHSYNYLMGERFCTPMPMKKIELDMHRGRLAKRWNEIAEKESWEELIDGKTVIMYPMQMQPEANLEVWGYPYKDQTATIRIIADQLEDDEVLLVKPNPRAKYELTDELISLVSNHKRIVIVKLNTPMSHVFIKTTLVVVVTGTTAMECILANKPVVTLANTLNNKQRNCPYVKKLADVRRFIDLAKKNNYIQITDDEKVGFINELVKTSFVGNPDGKDRDENVLNAFAKILHL